MSLTKADRKHSRLERTAYHEAGHAVACIQLKRPFKYVTIVPKEDSLGHVSHHGKPKSIEPDADGSGKTKSWIEREIIFALAGLAADHRFAGRHNWRGAGDDFRVAVDLASYLYFEPRLVEKYLDFMIEQAKCFVASPKVWTEIEVIAAALLERKTLSAREVKQVCREETPHGRRLAELELQLRASYWRLDSEKLTEVAFNALQVERVLSDAYCPPIELKRRISQMKPGKAIVQEMRLQL